MRRKLSFTCIVTFDFATFLHLALFFYRPSTKWILWISSYDKCACYTLRIKYEVNVSTYSNAYTQRSGITALIGWTGGARWYVAAIGDFGVLSGLLLIRRSTLGISWANRWYISLHGQTEKMRCYKIYIIFMWIGWRNVITALMTIKINSFECNLGKEMPNRFEKIRELAAESV